MLDKRKIDIEKYIFDPKLNDIGNKYDHT